MCQSVVDTKFHTCFDDIRFLERDQGRMDFPVAGVLDSGFGGQRSDGLERTDKLGATIRVAAVIDGVYADKQIVGIQRFCPG